ncbi:RHS repeat-associated core domain-containing protein [Gelidibacter salicanalis]|uniref:RHS repeat-associated core domain-containing protein n=1 Tax=Gelidibacter salicanalis TaxID=291193 RepID=A0A934KW27_9FLAO|nr:RHS repeat-associated core domain-containing protein [Gelidibacter salicanalis]MBJ7880435.1 hypothetical protein [Gelidibacter salicanalis]
MGGPSVKKKPRVWLFSDGARRRARELKLTDGNNVALTKFGVFDRGYTGHEHLLGVGLVHMNGRLYDPVLHRFLMPDNFVQDPYNTQSYNRYGYVLNNPLLYTDASGELFFIPILIGMAYGALVGAAISAAVYTISAAVTGNWNLSGFGTSILFGAIGGAISGGLSAAASIASTGVSSFLQSATGNMLSEVASQVGTSAIMGDNITLSTIAGSAVSGFAGAGIGNWKGVKGSWLKNGIGELGFNTFKGTVRGAVAGAVGAGLDGDNIKNAIVNGAKNGAIGAFSQSALMIGTFGATYKPGTEQLKYANKMADAFGLSTDKVAWRKGGAYQAIQSLIDNEREVTWGNSVATFSNTDPDIFAHEFGHIIQARQQGWSTFQGRGIFEQIFIGQSVYDRPGSNEYEARVFARDYGKAPKW